MCDVCSIETRDWNFSNGGKPLQRCRLYRVYVSRVALVSLCYLHSIELFCIGESRFLTEHPGFAISLHKSNRSSHESDSFSF